MIKFLSYYCACGDTTQTLNINHNTRIIWYVIYIIFTRFTNVLTRIKNINNQRNVTRDGSNYQVKYVDYYANNTY